MTHLPSQIAIKAIICRIDQYTMFNTLQFPQFPGTNMLPMQALASLSTPNWTSWVNWLQLSRLNVLNGENNEVVWQPLVDIYDDGKQYIVQIELAGAQKENIQLEVRNDSIQVTGEVKPKDVQREHIRHQERHQGKFLRIIQLPHKIRGDQAVAKYENGILEIHVPKAEDSQARKLRV